MYPKNYFLLSNSLRTFAFEINTTTKLMKHLFVINPQAGQRNATDEIKERIQLISNHIDTEIYITQAPGDATRYVRQRCAEGDAASLRFYACGGDGTLNEVASGLVHHPEAQLTSLPVGSGNDYIKYYGTREQFLDLDRLTSGTPHRVDLMQIASPDLPEPRYSLNITNFGFDAIVCKNAIRLRRTPIIGRRHSYTTGIIIALFNGWRTTCRVAADGTLLHDGPMLLCTLGNGRYNGGAYQCSPLSLNNDGLIELCLFKPMSIISFARLIGSYRDGTFIRRDDLRHRYTYRRATSVEITTPRPLDLCIDGEIITSNHFTVKQLPGALQFVTPAR